LTAPTNFPSKAELLACLPPKLLRLKPAKAWGILFMTLSLSLAAYGLGTRLFGTLFPVFHLLMGWPFYPLFGITGGEDYGTPTSHCWSAAPFRNGQRPLFLDACRPLIRHLNRALVAMLLAPSPGCQSVFASAGAVPVWPALSGDQSLAGHRPAAAALSRSGAPRPRPHPPGAVAGGH